MGFRTGIVGLPNVGKSTLFNALTRTAAAQAANFPFCTIEPNVGEVNVPDARLDRLAAIAKSARVVPTRMTFVDIAGLVKGASRGEGLGNQFLANIRECDAVAHVLRCFEDDDVAHVEGRVDPVADAETVETELMLADLESVEKRLAGLARKLKGGDKEAATQARLLEAAKAGARGGAAGALGGRRRGGRARLAAARAADGQARALRLQRRGGGGRERERALRGGGGAGGARGGGPRGDLGGDRGGDRPARRRRAGGVPGGARARRGRASTG